MSDPTSNNVNETFNYNYNYEPSGNFIINIMSNLEIIGYDVIVTNIILKNSAKLNITLYYLKNGTLNYSVINNGIHNIIRLDYTLKDEEYNNWGDDDNYIYNVINNNIIDILNNKL